MSFHVEYYDQATGDFVNTTKPFDDLVSRKELIIARFQYFPPKEMIKKYPSRDPRVTGGCGCTDCGGGATWMNLPKSVHNLSQAAWTFHRLVKAAVESKESTVELVIGLCGFATFSSVTGLVTVRMDVYHDIEMGYLFFDEFMQDVIAILDNSLPHPNPRPFEMPLKTSVHITFDTPCVKEVPHTVGELLEFAQHRNAWNLPLHPAGYRKLP